MPVGSKDLTPGALRAKTDEELVEELRKAKEALFNLRFQAATGQLESHGGLRAVRQPAAAPRAAHAPGTPARRAASTMYSRPASMSSSEPKAHM